jgi:hypothetical protein
MWEPGGRRSAPGRGRFPRSSARAGHSLWSVRLGLSALALLSAGCGSTLYLAINGSAPRGRAEVFDCAKSQILVLGYTQDSLDTDAFRITARKPDYENRVADTQFRRMMDRLAIEVGKPTEGSVRLKVEAHTFAELMTQRGPTQVEREASPAARTAAHALLDACGG